MIVGGEELLVWLVLDDDGIEAGMEGADALDQCGGADEGSGIRFHDDGKGCAAARE